MLAWFSLKAKWCCQHPLTCQQGAERWPTNTVARRHYLEISWHSLLVNWRGFQNASEP